MGTLYAYDKLTGEYLNPMDDGMPPGEQHQYIYDGFTYEVPPTYGVNEKPKFQSGTWSLVPDFRFATIYMKDRSQPDHSLLIFGEPLPSVMTLIPPPGNAYVWSESADGWVIDPILEDQYARAEWRILRDVHMVAINRNIHAYEDAEKLTGWGTPTDSGYTLADYQAMIQYRYDLGTTLYPTPVPSCPISLLY